ncbi:hypothetical protein F5884DRAFT_848319 [Xylogone sp. PMI_703]|nr:hypothetical protein F5884DRAFT_848319 [Xylogone sp. PMI_703]
MSLTYHIWWELMNDRIDYPTMKLYSRQHLAVECHEFDLEQAPPEGGIVTKNFYTSFDPYIRGRIRDKTVKLYSDAYELGEVIVSSSIARVLKSDSSKFKVGDLIVGFIPAEEYSSIPKQLAESHNKIENPCNLDLLFFLGPLGETIFISAASGAVGQLVGQIAERESLRVIGSVGSDEKLEFVMEELGFDGGFNYKKEKPGDALDRLAPDGVDIYYENVGGEQLEAALKAKNNCGRIVSCGMVSEYNKSPEERYGSKNLLMVGFVVTDADMGPAYAKERDENVGKWLYKGSCKAKFSVTDSIDMDRRGLLS